MSEYSITRFADDEALATAVAELWLGEIAAARRQGRRHTVALSGGRVTTRVFAAMAALARVGRLDPSPARFFWADERCVPPDHPDSNYAAARIGLLDPLAVAAEHIHRIRGEVPPALAASEAAAALRRVTGAPAGAMPVLDLVLLGMGEDGHVASLFPGHEAILADESAVFLPVLDSPKPPAARVTLGLGALLAAREVWVVVAGPGKETALRESLAPAGRTPLARLLQRRAGTRILTSLP